MPFNLLLLPLIGGYLFISICHCFRYRAKRSEGYRLLIDASIAGTIFLGVATVLIHIINLYPAGERLTAQWQQVFLIPDSDIGVLALILGLASAYLMNWAANLSRLGGWFSRFSVLSDAASVERAVNAKQDAAEVFIQKAQRSGTLVSITLKSGKVYVGKIQKMFNPAFDVSSLKLQLDRSGYRKEETSEVVFTTFYTEAYQEVTKELRALIVTELTRIIRENPEIAFQKAYEKASEEVSSNPKFALFELVLYTSEIVSMNAFRPDTYEEHFNDDE